MDKTPQDGDACKGDHKERTYGARVRVRVCVRVRARPSRKRGRMMLGLGYTKRGCMVSGVGLG